MSEPRPALTPEEFRLLAEFVRGECGIDVPGEKQYLIDVRFAHLLGEERCASYMELYNRARADLAGRLKERLIDAIVTNETHWFRDGRAWDALRTVVVPELVRVARQDAARPVRIWCAGCSTGQEPYSLAMLIDEQLGARPAAQGFHILATDISRAALAIAREGRYNRISMSRGLDAGRRARYFRAVGNLWEIKPNLRAAVEFRPHNLLQPMNGGGPFDLVLCRNVAIYFSEPFRQRLFRNIAAVLRPGSRLFVGTSELMLPDLRGFAPVADGVYFRFQGLDEGDTA